MKKLKIALIGFGGLVFAGSGCLNAFQYYLSEQAKKENKQLQISNDVKQHRIEGLQQELQESRETLSKIKQGLDYFVSKQDATQLLLSFISNETQLGKEIETLSGTQQLLLTENEFPCFKDIPKFSSKHIQELLRGVPWRDLVYALKGADQETLEAVYTNMSQRSSEIIRSDIEYFQGITSKETRLARLRITRLMRELHAKERISVEVPAEV